MSIHRRGKVVLAVKLGQLILDQSNLLAFAHGSRWECARGSFHCTAFHWRRWRTVGSNTTSKQARWKR